MHSVPQMDQLLNAHVLSKENHDAVLTDEARRRWRAKAALLYISSQILFSASVVALQVYQNRFQIIWLLESDMCTRTLQNEFPAHRVSAGATLVTPEILGKEGLPRRLNILTEVQCGTRIMHYNRPDLFPQEHAENRIPIVLFPISPLSIGRPHSWPHFIQPDRLHRCSPWQCPRICESAGRGQCNAQILPARQGNLLQV